MHSNMKEAISTLRYAMSVICGKDDKAYNACEEAISFLKAQEDKLRFLEFLSNHMNPNDLEMYYSMYGRSGKNNTKAMKI